MTTDTEVLPDLTLDDLDTDGALGEAIHETAGHTRGDILRRGLIGGGAILGAGALLGPAGALGAGSKGQDVTILNYALTLEYLEAAFYTEAEAKGRLRGELARFAKIVGAHERAHVVFLRKALGSKAVKRPRFDFQGNTTNPVWFQKTAILLEDTGVAAYAAQGPRIHQAPVAQAALSIHSVEARHAAWIRNIAGAPPSPKAFDPALTMDQVLAAVKKTGFIVG